MRVNALHNAADFVNLLIKVDNDLLKRQNKRVYQIAKNTLRLLMEIAEYSANNDIHGFLSQIDSCDWTSAEFLSSIIKDGSFESVLGGWAKLFLLTEGGRLISFITLSCQDCVDDKTLSPWLGFFFTIPQYRGRRLGKKVLDHACCEAKNMGYNAVYLATAHIGLYEKYGFVYVESRKDVYGDESRIYAKTL